MTIGANKLIQNIPAPFHLVAMERARENWKNRKIEILVGSGLAITGLVLIPIIGAYAAIVCGAGLAILSHGLFADPTSSPPLLQNKAMRARTAAAPKKSPQLSLEDIPLQAKRAMAGASVLGSAAVILAINELLKPVSGQPTPPQNPTGPTPTPTSTTPNSNPAPLTKTFIISIGGSKPISHNVSDEPVSPILTPAEVETPIPSAPAKGLEIGDVAFANPGHLTTSPPTPSSKPLRLSFFTVAETLGFFTASSTPDEILLSYLRSQPKDAICAFPSGFGPRQGSETLRISSNASKEPAEPFSWEGFDFSKTPDRKILFFTASHEAVTANPTGKELALPSAARSTITVTEMNVKDFVSAQHSQRLFESLKEFYSSQQNDAGKSPLALPLPSGTPTMASPSLVSASSPATKPFSLLTVSEILKSSSPTPNDALFSYLLSQPKDAICVLPAKPLSLPAPNVHAEPSRVFGSQLGDFDFSLSPLTVSQEKQPTSLPNPPIRVSEKIINKFAPARHTQFPLPLIPFHFDPRRLTSVHANSPSNSSNISTSDPTLAFTHKAQTIAQPSLERNDAAFDAKLASDLSAAPHQIEPPVDMFSSMSSWIQSWFSLGSAQPEIPIANPSPLVLEGDLPKPDAPALGEPVISNTSSDTACDDLLEFRPSQYLLDARSKLKSDRRDAAFIKDLLDSTFGKNDDPLEFRPAFGPTNATPTDTPETVANRRLSQFLLDARSKLKSDRHGAAFVNDLMDSVLGFNSSSADCKEDALLNLAPKTTALDPIPPAAPQIEPSVDMFSYVSSWISWFSSRSAQPAVSIPNLLPVCPANFTPLATGLHKQLATLPPTSADAPTTTLTASPATLAPNLMTPLAIGALLFLAANGSKKSLEFCSLTDSPQTGPLDVNEITALVLKKHEEPSLLSSLLSVGFTHAQSAAKTGVSLLASEVLYPAGSYAYTKGGEALAELRDQGAAGLQSNLEERKQEFVNYGLALKWTADTGVPWIAKEVVYPTGAYVYTQASWILPEIRDRGVALLRSAARWTAENGLPALTAMAKGVREKVQGAYKRLTLPSPDDKPSKPSVEQEILPATGVATPSPVLEKQDSPTAPNAESSNLASTNRLWNPPKVEEKKVVEEIFATPIATVTHQAEMKEAAALPQKQPEALGSQSRFEDAIREDALFDAEVALLIQDPIPAEKSSEAVESQKDPTKGGALPEPQPAPTENSEARENQNEGKSSMAGFREKYKKDKEAYDKIDAESAASAEKNERDQAADDLMDAELAALGLLD